MTLLLSRVKQARDGEFINSHIAGAAKCDSPVKSSAKPIHIILQKSVSVP
jgi:hypothetical protein